MSALVSRRADHDTTSTMPAGASPLALVGSHLGDFVKEAAARRHAIRFPEGPQGDLSGRGALTNRSGRFEALERAPAGDDIDGRDEDLLPAARTQVTAEKARTIITRNDSPDISFDRSVNPYRGCEHGCVYCYARPTHAYMGLSAGLDFETRLFAKEDAAVLLERELSAPGYVPRTIAIGTNTDAYQPIERQFRSMRQILQVLQKTRHPVGIVTKSALVTRDIDILAEMAQLRLAKVAISVTTLDPRLARAMEPRASSPAKRIDAISRLAEAGIPVSVMVAPVIPGLNDHEIEDILGQARAAGASEAGYVMLRLPLEVDGLFREWLLKHYPDRYRRVMSLMSGMRGGKSYDATFGKRMTGEGPHAWMTGRRFEIACQKLGFNLERLRLRTDLFEAPKQKGAQLSLF